MSNKIDSVKIVIATEHLSFKPSTARIDTFDGFVYELPHWKLMGENYPVLVSVKAELPKVGADAVLNSRG